MAPSSSIMTRSSSPLTVSSSQTFRLFTGLLVLSVVLGPVQSSEKENRSLSQRSSSSENLAQCKEPYDRVIFAKLDRICEDCWNLYKDLELDRACYQPCFSSRYFMGCLEALDLYDERKTYEDYIKQINGATSSK